MGGVPVVRSASHNYVEQMIDVFNAGSGANTATRDKFPRAVLPRTFDYGFAFKEWRQHPCRCGSKRCAGFIVNSAQRWRLKKIPRAERVAARAAS